MTASVLKQDSATNKFKRTLIQNIIYQRSFEPFCVWIPLLKDQYARQPATTELPSKGRKGNGISLLTLAGTLKTVDVLSSRQC